MSYKSLQENQELFLELIDKTSIYFGFPEEFVEKDYYITLFLKYLSNKCPNLIFKGGTSLSKGHHIIRRFSEDIDLNIIHENLNNSRALPTQRERRNLSTSIREVIEDLKLVYMNFEALQSRASFNRYIVEYPTVIEDPSDSHEILVETSLFLQAYPTQLKPIQTYIAEYLQTINRSDIIYAYNLDAFMLHIQDIERTFIDKLFALGDYYLSGKVYRHSRHIYDLHKIYPHIVINDKLKELFIKIRNDRREDEGGSISAKDGINLREVLQEIIDSGFFKDDYSVTENMFFRDENVTYEDAIFTLQEIVDSDLLDLYNDFHNAEVKSTNIGFKSLDF